jgi:SulP family sulfate permease
MVVMVIQTFAWSSFRIIRKIPKGDAVVLFIVSAVTVFVDLAVAVFVGVIISALVFAWKNAVSIRARKTIKEDGTKVYAIWGPLFFGSIQNFNEKFDVNKDPESIEIDFIESKVSDHSGMEAITNLVNKYEKVGKKVILKHLSPDCQKLLIKGNKNFSEIIEENIDDPRYFVITDQEENFVL